MAKRIGGRPGKTRLLPGLGYPIPLSQTDVSVALSGVSASGEVGSVVEPAAQGGDPAPLPFLGLILAPSSGTSVALTGTSATGAVGTTALQHDQALTGASATGAVGATAPQHDRALTGAGATGAVGTLSTVAAMALTGAAASGAVNAPGVDHVQALTGAEATGGVGTVSPSSDTQAALSGVQATGGVGSTGVSTSLSASGAAATAAVGSSPSSNAVPITGTSATGAVGSVTAVTATSGGGEAAPLPFLSSLFQTTPGVVPLTGVQATGALGSLGKTAAVALTGVQGNTVAGDVGILGAEPPLFSYDNGVPGAWYLDIGFQATYGFDPLGVPPANRANAGSDVSVGLTGVSAAVSVGSVAVPGDVTIALTGVEALGQVGDVSVAPDRIGGGYDDDKPKRRKHRWLVQVGNKVYEVESAQAARDLMDRIDAEEAPKLEKAIQERMQVKKPRARIVSAPVPVAQAKQRTDDAALVTQMLLRRIAEYNAIIDAVVRLAEEQDDEEALLMLL